MQNLGTGLDFRPFFAIVPISYVRTLSLALP